jgi:plasmid stabilization system protein ParE
VVKEVIISRNAYLDLDRIIEFNNLRNQSTRYSEKFLKLIFKEFYKLKRFPLMGIETSRKNNFLLIWNDYYIYYDITEISIEIKSVYHQKEDILR